MTGRRRQAEVATAQQNEKGSKAALSEGVYDILRHRIYERQLLVGSKLNIDQLARDLGVSATPVRDAINRMVAERLAVYEPYQGYSLAPPLRAAELEKVMDVRELLEVHAVKESVVSAKSHEIAELSACIRDMEKRVNRLSFSSFKEFDRRDNDFHELIIKFAKNPFLVESYQPISARARMARLYYADGVTDAEAVIQEHRAVLRAFRARDTKAAVQALSKHLLAARRRLFSMMGKMDDETEGLALALRNHRRDHDDEQTR